MSIPSITHASPVTLPLSALKSQSTDPIPTSTLLSAFGPSSLGIIVISGLPSNFPTLRARVLTKISHLAHLPPAQLEQLVNEKAKYLVGWSHGKESLKEGKVDWGKGSYYVNCAFDENDQVLKTMRKNWKGFDEYTAPNVWPDENEEGLKDFQADVEELVGLIVEVAGLVARAVDGFAEKNVDNYPVNKTGDQMGYLEGVVTGSRTSKARLLHYFPSEEQSKGNGISGHKDDADVDDSWCTTHKDHSCLTGLTSAAFFDEASEEKSYQELPSSPSPSAGLYILDREGKVHKVAIPKDCLAFQTGQALETITKGKLKAVPHFVRGVEAGETKAEMKVARNTLAVFTQPNLDDVVELDSKLTFGEFARGIVKKNTAG